MLLSLRRQHPHLVPISVIIILHVVGLFGLNSAWRELFLQLTHFTLIISSIIVWWQHQGWTRAELGVMVLCFAVGYGMELAGVHTGVIFGEYDYGTGFGPKVIDVPPLIGLNWAILIYATASVSRYLFTQPLVRILLGATLMTGLDWVMEPMAIKLGFWTWETATIPLRNYLAWFLISLVLHLVWDRASKAPSQATALAFFLIQLGFFSLLRLF